MAVDMAHPDSSRVHARRRRSRRLRRLAPLAVWTGVLIVTIVLYTRREGGLTVTGFARAIRYQVAPETAGRVDRLEVQLHDEVAAGQIVASLADDELRLQLREARAELALLARNLAEEEVLFEVDRQTNLRRFARDAANAHIEYLDALAELAEDRITLQGLELTLNRTRQLHANEVATDESLDEDLTSFEALGERIAGLEAALDERYAAYRDTEARFRDYLAATPEFDRLPTSRESALAVQEVRIEMVNLALARRVLRAPVSGRVVEVLARGGEVVAAGQPVLAIVEARAADVVAFLPEQNFLEARSGDAVEIRRVADPRQTFVSSVVSLGGSIEPLPIRIGPEDTVPRWGLAVSIAIPSAMATMPGEAFEISFR